MIFGQSKPTDNQEQVLFTSGVPKDTNNVSQFNAFEQELGGDHPQLREEWLPSVSSSRSSHLKERSQQSDEGL